MAKRRFHHGAFSFSNRPMLYHSRSQFDLSFHHKTTMNAGDLVPFYVQEIYPGDTFKCDSSVVARISSALLKPVMDNAFIDLYYFFVPNRLVFDKWQNVMGENTDTKWANPTAVSVPVVGNTGSVGQSTIADYMGIPSGLTGATIASDGGISVLPFRAYALIYDEWFRDENLQDPILIQKSTTGPNESFNSNDFGPNNYFGKCAKINKTHDMFTSCLPSPQKGNAVTIGTAQVPERTLPVSTYGVNTLQLTSNSKLSRQLVPDDSHVNDLLSQMGVTGNGTTGSKSVYYSTAERVPNAIPQISRGYLMLGSTGTTNAGHEQLSPTSDTGTTSNSLYPTNFYAYDPGLALQSATVNDLRFAFQLQKMLEKDARGGTRYTEYLREHFGVVSPDSRLQRPEFLGGKRFPISVFQVAQTSQSTTDDPLAQVGAFSLSNGHGGYTKGFVENGFVIGVMAIRQFHTYQQGIEQFWFRKNRTDFYDPVFSNIGEQPIYTKNIYANVGNADTVFGYNEAWVDLRYRPSRTSGLMRSTTGSGFDVWHFGDNYSSAPVLGDQFIKETPQYIDRAIALSSEQADQFIVDVYCRQTAIRELPTYSAPGLIDHH